MNEGHDVCVPDAARAMPMFPLSTVLFPHAPLPVHVFEPRYRKLTADCLAGDRELGVVLITRGSEVGGRDERATVGTVARIEEAVPMPDGRWFLLFSGQRRVEVTSWLPDDPYPRAEVVDLADDDAAGSAPTASPDDDIAGRTAALAAALAAVRMARGLLSEAGHGPALAMGESDLDADHQLAGWHLCDAAPVGLLDRQRLLEAPGFGSRMELLARLSSEVADDVRRMLTGG
jgi:Lon protease-like protein